MLKLDKKKRSEGARSNLWENRLEKRFERPWGKRSEERSRELEEVRSGRREKRKQSWLDWREVSNHLEKRLEVRIVVRKPPILVE